MQGRSRREGVRRRRLILRFRCAHARTHVSHARSQMGSVRTHARTRGGLSPGRVLVRSAESPSSRLRSRCVRSAHMAGAGAAGRMRRAPELPARRAARRARSRRSCCRSSPAAERPLRCSDLPPRADPIACVFRRKLYRAPGACVICYVAVNAHAGMHPRERADTSGLGFGV
jgi:hypothetical protein